MTKQEIIREIASLTGDLDIALRAMTPEAAREEMRSVCESLREIVHREHKGAILISGD